MKTFLTYAMPLICLALIGAVTYLIIKEIKRPQFDENGVFIPKELATVTGSPVPTPTLPTGTATYAPI